MNACQCTNRTTLTQKFKEIENWEEYIVVPVWHEEGIIMECMYICAVIKMAERRAKQEEPTDGKLHAE